MQFRGCKDDRELELIYSLLSRTRAGTEPASFPCISCMVKDWILVRYTVLYLSDHAFIIHHYFFTPNLIWQPYFPSTTPECLAQNICKQRQPPWWLSHQDSNHCWHRPAMSANNEPWSQIDHHITIMSFFVLPFLSILKQLLNFILEDGSGEHAAIKGWDHFVRMSTKIDDKWMWFQCGIRENVK